MLAWGITGLGMQVIRFAGQSVRLLFVVVALLGAMGHAGQVRAASYAAIVMDMRNGKVLHARSADRRQPRPR